MHIKKQRLLTRGPTPLYPAARHAMMASDVHHRTQDFVEIQNQALASLKEVLGTSNDVFILVSSGLGGLEASASNFLSTGDKVIICCAGKFGERWVEIAKAYSLNAVVLKSNGDVFTSERLEAALAENPDAKAVMVQASETSTGAMYDVEAMAAAVKKTDALFIVDATTGIGTMHLDIDGWGIDICVGGSQKSFMIPPGLTFVTVSAKAWKANETATISHFYVDLKKEKKMIDTSEGSSWTPKRSHIIALNAALDYIKQLGMAKLIENSQLLAKATREAAKALGLELFATNVPGNSVTAVKAPAGRDSGVIGKGFRTNFGAIIANGLGTMKGQIFRMAHLGYFDLAEMFAVIAALGLILQANGHKVELGSGVAAVQRVYAEAAMPSSAKA